MKFTRLLLLAVLALAALNRPCDAALNVLFLGYEPSFYQDPRSDILGADARFDLANSATIRNSVPDLATLLLYDAVLMWTDSPPLSGIGDLLGDYVDAGGGVVLATFNGQHEEDDPAWASSRINSAGYNPLGSPDFDAYQPKSLGAYNAAHPLMADVSTLASSQYNSDYNSVEAGAELVASWHDGTPLAAVNAAGNVVAITLNPNVTELGHATGDYRELFRNALAYVADPAPISPVPEPATMTIWSLGALGCALAAYRRRKTSRLP